MPHAKVAILGVGPSGIAAATAVLRFGGDVTLIAKRIEPSHLYGCQYLHTPIPGFEDVGKTEVNYQLIGSSEDYRLKVYGAEWDGEVSPQSYVGRHTAWDIRETYQRMWVSVAQQPYRVNWSREYINPTIASSLWKYDMVISTIPAPALCAAGHSFRSHTIYANGDTQPFAIYPPDNTIVYDGTDEHLWYRYARVFGYGTVEWASQVGPGAEVTKPLSTNCGCLPDIVRAGRYGVWRKGILVHQVYQQAEQAMRLLNGDDEWKTADIPEQVCRECARWGEVLESEGNRYYVCSRGHIWAVSA